MPPSDPGKLSVTSLPGGVDRRAGFRSGQDHGYRRFGPVASQSGAQGAGVQVRPGFSRTRPHGSKLWANEIMRGAPLFQDMLDEHMAKYCEPIGAPSREFSTAPVSALNPSAFLSTQAPLPVNEREQRRALLLMAEQLPGIGEWTAHYIAMRVLKHPDAFRLQT